MQSSINPNLVIEDTQPSLVRSWADLLYAISSVVIGVFTLLSSMCLSATADAMKIDARSATQIIGLSFNNLSFVLIQQGLTLIVVAEVIAHMVSDRRWIDTAISVITLFISYGSVWLLSIAIFSTHNIALIESLQMQSNN
ncbi:TIGR00374 family protein, partial [Bifidobacteriaceae bacterium WP022]